MELTKAIDSLDFDKLNFEIKRTIKRSAKDMVQLGYMLRRMMEQKLYLNQYSCFDEYLSGELHMDYTMASRFIGANKKYAASTGMEIAKKWEDYSQSVLIEMLNMPPELEEQVTPDMTVKQVREIKRQEKRKSEKMRVDARGFRDAPHCAACGTKLKAERHVLPQECPVCGQMQDWEQYLKDFLILDSEELPPDVQDAEFRELPAEPEKVATSQLCEEKILHDKDWFIRQYVEIMHSETDELLDICRKERNNSDRAKAIQKHIAPYGCRATHCSEYSFSFGSFARGLDFQVGEEKQHLTYRELAAGLLKILEEQENKTGEELRSAYGLLKSEYPEDSLIAIAGCGNKHDCFSCAQDCNIRQQERYCRYAPMGNPFSCTTMKVMENLKEEMGDKCQFINNDLANHTAGSKEASPCCENCTELCGYRCQRSAGRKIEHLEDPETETGLPEVKDVVQPVRDILQAEQKLLNDYLEVGYLSEKTVDRQKIIVAALAAMVCDLESTTDPEPDSQPELPILKNNDQRKEWLGNYRDWGLWYRDKNLDVNYYKYDFSDGSRLIVEEYLQRAQYWDPKKLYDEHHYHLLEKDRKGYNGTLFDNRYCHSADSETYLVEFLKNLQKNR